MTQKAYKIGIIPGDGIGPEVIKSTLALLDGLCPSHGITLDYVVYELGAEVYRRTGHRITSQEMDEIGELDAVLLGAMGLPDVRMPDGTECGPQVDLRGYLGLFASLRPARLYRGIPTRMQFGRDQKLDILVIRETTEGMFAGLNDSFSPNDSELTDRMTITRKTCLKLFRTAFNQARHRRQQLGTPGKVTLLHKSNALRSNTLLVKVFKEIATEFPDIEWSEYYIDAGAMYFVTDPERYDVVVTENIFGDIVSEVAAGLVGGLGVAPSGDISERHGIFQPSHGSAPDIAGKNVANPVAMWLSAVMMLDWLGETRGDDKCLEASKHLQQVIEKQLADGPKTRDIGGNATTTEVTQCLLSWL
ncbi:3-isopropylmalate dehydrogenase [Ilyonectria robusta]